MKTQGGAVNTKEGYSYADNSILFTPTLQFNKPLCEQIASIQVQTRIPVHVWTLGFLLMFTSLIYLFMLHFVENLKDIMELHVQRMPNLGDLVFYLYITLGMWVGVLPVVVGLRSVVLWNRPCNSNRHLYYRYRNTHALFVVNVVALILVSLLTFRYAFTAFITLRVDCLSRNFEIILFILAVLLVFPLAESASITHHRMVLFWKLVRHSSAGAYVTSSNPRLQGLELGWYPRQEIAQPPPTEDQHSIHVNEETSATPRPIAETFECKPSEASPLLFSPQIEHSTAVDASPSPLTDNAPNKLPYLETHKLISREPSAVVVMKFEYENETPKRGDDTPLDVTPKKMTMRDLKRLSQHQLEVLKTAMHPVNEKPKLPEQHLDTRTRRKRHEIRSVDDYIDQTEDNQPLPNSYAPPTNSVREKKPRRPATRAQPETTAKAKSANSLGAIIENITETIWGFFSKPAPNTSNNSSRETHGSSNQTTSTDDSESYAWPDRPLERYTSSRTFLPRRDYYVTGLRLPDTRSTAGMSQYSDRV